MNILGERFEPAVNKVIKLNKMLKEYALKIKFFHVDYHTPLKDDKTVYNRNCRRRNSSKIRVC